MDFFAVYLMDFEIHENIHGIMKETDCSVKKNKTMQGHLER